MTIFTEKIPAYASLMALEEWVANITPGGGFTDYDGFGHPAKEGLMAGDVLLLPSRGEKNVPSGTTHVVWFNR
jgi:hypothetical protein